MSTTSELDDVFNSLKPLNEMTCKEVQAELQKYNERGDSFGKLLKLRINYLSDVRTKELRPLVKEKIAIEANNPVHPIKLYELNYGKEVYYHGNIYHMAQKNMIDSSIGDYVRYNSIKEKESDVYRDIHILDIDEYDNVEGSEGIYSSGDSRHDEEIDKHEVLDNNTDYDQLLSEHYQRLKLVTADYIVNRLIQPKTMDNRTWYTEKRLVVCGNQPLITKSASKCKK
jgi:hypothetical protein